MGRTPLKTGIEITEGKNIYTVEINSVCGYGTSSIVYYGKLNGNNVLVKEIYPADLDITRGGDNCSLIVPKEQEDRFDYYKKTAKNAYETQKVLYNNSSTNNATQFTFLKGECNGTSYYISEFTNGITLEKWINTYRNDDDFVKNLLLICMRISDVLHDYHEIKYIHLDVKPSNILVVQIDNNDYNVLMFDFDSVYTLEDLKNDKNDYVRYSPGYVAPEVEYFTQDIDQDRTDIYSVGAILYKGIFGKELPTGGINRRYTFYWSDVESIKPISIELKNLELKNRLEEIFRKTLSISVCGRYEKAEDLSKALTSAITSTIPNDLDVNFLNRIKGSRSETDKKINDGSKYSDTRMSIMESFKSAFGLLEINQNKKHVISKELINSIIGILRFIPFVSYDEKIMSLCNWLSEIIDLSDNEQFDNKQFMINTHQLYCMKFSDNKANFKELILKLEITEEDLASEDPFEVEIYCRFLGLLCEYYYESMISKDNNKKVFLDIIKAHKALRNISDNTINKFKGYNRLLIATDILQIGYYTALSLSADLSEEGEKLLDIIEKYECEVLLGSLRLKRREEEAFSKTVDNKNSEEWLIPLICYSLLKGTIMSIRQVQFDESNNADQYIFSGYYLLCRFYDIVSGREKYDDEEYIINYKKSGMEEIISHICHLLLKTICKKQEDENTEPFVLAESFFWEREDYELALYFAEVMQFFGSENVDIEKYFKESSNTLYELFCSDDSQTEE